MPDAHDHTPAPHPRLSLAPVAAAARDTVVDGARRTGETAVRAYSRPSGSSVRLAPPADAARPARVSLLDVDAELEAAVPAADRARARSVLQVPLHRFGPSAIELGVARLPQSTFAMLIADGSLLCEAHAGPGQMVELMDAGDVVMPFEPPTALLATCAALTATEGVLMAPLDRGFMRAAAVWPELMLVVQRRLHEQHHRLAIHGAICQLPRVEQRLLGMMWHLADRIGKVSAEGIILARPFNHQALAGMVGARRPTVSIALKALQERGQLRRRRDGMWVLPFGDGTPAVRLEELLARLESGRSLQAPRSLLEAGVAEVVRTG